MHSDFSNALGAAIFFAVIILAVLWLNDRLGRWRRKPRKASGRSTAGIAGRPARLAKPDWDFYERHLQRPVPAALRELYGDADLLAAEHLKCGGGVCISTFNPIEEGQLLDARDLIGREVLAFATSEYGDPIYLRPGREEPDTVYITYHDGGETEVVARSVAELCHAWKTK